MYRLIVFASCKYLRFRHQHVATSPRRRRRERRANANLSLHSLFVRPLKRAERQEIEKTRRHGVHRFTNRSTVQPTRALVSQHARQTSQPIRSPPLPVGQTVRSASRVVDRDVQRALRLDSRLDGIDRVQRERAEQSTERA